MNARDSLSQGGWLVLDSAGATENPVVYLMDNWFLRIEAMVVRLIKSLTTGKPHTVVVKHYGYRRSNKEILEATQAAGFRLVSPETYGHLLEFERSVILRKLIERIPGMNGLFSVLGTNTPYVRSYILEKV